MPQDAAWDTTVFRYLLYFIALIFVVETDEIRSDSISSIENGMFFLYKIDSLSCALSVLSLDTFEKQNTQVTISNSTAFGKQKATVREVM